MKDTYLMINGQKIELTAEQKKQLGIVEEQKQNCFDRKAGKKYYYINFTDVIIEAREAGHGFDDNTYNVANYCTDKALIYQRAMHETLNRLLWRYSMTHDGDKIDWNNHKKEKWFIGYDYQCTEFSEGIGVGCSAFFKTDGLIYFYSKKIADSAIEEIVKPFMKEHPDFVW